ncbi:MAG: hypothetical protein K8F36_03500 [Melioribacteraceae bacterium]|nr:hypothetical protein [Melioribacteraceae bacterium]
MNSINKEKLLIKKLDGNISLKDEIKLRKLFNNSDEFENELNEMKSLRDVIAQNASTGFSDSFESNVMSIIQTSNAFRFSPLDDFLESVFTQFRRLAIPTIAIILVLVTLTFVYNGEISLDPIFGSYELTIEESLNPANFLAME